MNSIHLLQQYVERQNKIWLALEMDKGRGVDLADVEDPRVDLCLFCIQAHRLRPVDLRSALYSLDCRQKSFSCLDWNAAAEDGTALCCYAVLQASHNCTGSYPFQ